MNITFDVIQAVVWVVTLSFVLYGVFHKPQEKTEKVVEILDQQFTGFKQIYESRHDELQKQIMELEQNHIHTLQVRMDGLCDKMNLIENGQVRLATIIEERIPKLK